VLSIDNGTWQIEKVLKRDGTATDGAWKPVFDGLDDQGVYTLVVYQAPNKGKHTIFKGRKYGEWMA
jgi:hypothetical protein